MLSTRHLSTAIEGPPDLAMSLAAHGGEERSFAAD